MVRPSLYSFVAIPQREFLVPERESSCAAGDALPKHEPAKPMAITQVVTVRTMVQKEPRPRDPSQQSGRFDSEEFDAGQRDYAHDLGCSLRARQYARPIARLRSSIGYPSNFELADDTSLRGSQPRSLDDTQILPLLRLDSFRACSPRRPRRSHRRRTHYRGPSTPRNPLGTQGWPSTHRARQRRSIQTSK